MYTLTVDVSQAGTGTIQINGAVLSDFPNTATVAADVALDVKAVPASGYEFVRWEGDVTGSGNPLRVYMSANKTLTAYFSKVKHSLSIGLSDGGQTDPPAGTSAYEEGYVTTITATPNAGWDLSEWQGDVSGAERTSLTIHVTMDSDKAVKPVFSQVTHTLIVITEGNGTTTPVTGSYDYNEGDMVAITAIPEDGWTFAGWTGDVQDTEQDITVTMDSDTSITAEFSKNPVNWGLIGGISGGVLLAGAGMFWVLKAR